jgi:hypothetical protein
MFAQSHVLGTGAAIAIMTAAALAQAPKQAQQMPPQQSPQQQQPQAQQQQPQQQQPPVVWEQMQRMTLEAEFAGPLKDTTIQRWYDPSTDAVCYTYLPFTAQHSAPSPSGYVMYGPNTIGTISCLPGRFLGTTAAPPKAAAAAPKAKAPPPAKGTP